MDDLDDKIARHSIDEGHWPGLSVDQIKAKISDVRAGQQEAIDFGFGRRIFRKGDTVLIEDGQGFGTVFRPKWTSAAGYVQWFAEQELKDD